MSRSHFANLLLAGSLGLTLGCSNGLFHRSTQGNRMHGGENYAIVGDGPVLEDAGTIVTPPPEHCPATSQIPQLTQPRRLEPVPARTYPYNPSQP